ncbi:MAG: hypothetical protein ACE361_02455 [Aureliella sp.]
MAFHERLGQSLMLFELEGRVTSASEHSAVVDFGMQGYVTVISDCEGDTKCILSFTLPAHLLTDPALEAARQQLFHFFLIPSMTPSQIRAHGIGFEGTEPPVLGNLRFPNQRPTLESIIRIVNPQYRWDRPPNDDIYSVPRQFDMATVFTMFVAFSLLFSGMLALGANPLLILVFSSYFVVVGAAQAVLFDGEKPREASVIVGAIYGILVMFIAMASGSRVWGPGMFLFSFVWAPFAGYLAGTVNGGIWLITDYLRKWLERRQSRQPKEATQASPFDDVPDQPQVAESLQSRDET